jgi:hypothetical protein
VEAKAGQDYTTAPGNKEAMPKKLRKIPRYTVFLSEDR